MFQFKGEISSSKSLFNRALILQSFFPELQLHGFSQARDVVDLQKALQQLALGQKEFDLGEGGTSFRFFLLRCSREPGDYTFHVRPRLFERPHDEFFDIGQQLGFEFFKKSHCFYLNTSGWHLRDVLKVPSHRSSQFLSSLVLNSWNLPKEILIEKGPVASRSYFDMTQQMCHSVGLQILEEEKYWRIPAYQQLSQKHFTIEPDMSSVFALACCAAVAGDVEIQNVQPNSLQPDMQGLKYLERMGVPIQWKANSVKISKTPEWQGLDIDIHLQPDLFPCLSALLLLAKTPSRILGTEVLQYKESDRLFHMIQTMRNLGARVEEVANGIVISPLSQKPIQNFSFNTHYDHRLAFAFQIWKLAGLSIEIQNPQVVSKSFPEFWSIVTEGESR